MRDNIGFSVRSDMLKSDVRTALLHRGIVSYEGKHGPLSQTKEEYTELVVSAGSFENMRTALIGAIASFAVYGDAKPGDCKCYWRIEPDYEQNDSSHRCYARFLITTRAEVKD